MSGQRDRVWHELRCLGDRVRDPEHAEGAEAVVREAMKRVRANVETIIGRLRESGYRFGDPWSQGGASVPLALPDAHTPVFVAALEKRFGPLPLTVRAFIEIVGDVNLMGTHPSWPTELISDPLVVEFECKSWPGSSADRTSMLAYFEDEHDSWSEDEGLSDAPFCLDVAPDALIKANLSGGQPYGVLVPDASVDAMFRFDGGVILPFVEYLSLAFRHGGFVGFWRHDHGAVVLRERRLLAAGLLEL